MAARNTSALLLGSYKYEKREPRDGKNAKRVDKKGGIKRVHKGKLVDADAWTKRDLDCMEQFMTVKDIHVFDTLNYLEQDKDDNYREGRKEILEKIARFFLQGDKTHFVLYFTGHGADDGSWCFPVSTRKDITSRSSTRASEESQEQVYDLPQTTHAESNSSTATTHEVLAEVHDDADGSDSVPKSKMSTEGASNVPPPPHSSTDVQPAVPPDVRARADSLISLLAQYNNIDEKPAPTKRWNDFVTYDDVIQAWDETKQGKDRFLMMILDCCHSGRWVNRVNGIDDGIYNNQQDGAADATEQPRFKKRHDVCIQAACRPTEECRVADDQLSSIFTTKFVDAQKRSPYAKMLLTVLDHLPVINAVSIANSPILHPFTPISSDCTPFDGFTFFDSFDDMHLKT